MPSEEFRVSWRSKSRQGGFDVRCYRKSRRGPRQNFRYGSLSKHGCIQLPASAFLSADLAGSTLYKAGVGSRLADTGSPFPVWIATIRRFYRDFPKIYARNFPKVLPIINCREDYRCPTVWKTIGDEIVFCVRVETTQHLVACVSAFINTLKEYDGILAADQISLGVKGTAWVAAFPGVNMTASVGELNKTDYIQEQFEIDADSIPKNFDFLGPQIDAGFRIGKHSSQERFIVSMELGWLLTKCDANGMKFGRFYYHGREVLKDVLRDRPYPIIAIDADRRPERQLVLDKQNRLLGSTESSANGWQIEEYLSGFFKLEGIEFPVLVGEGENIDEKDWPSSYVIFRNNAEQELKGIIAQEASMDESSNVREESDSGTGEMPEAVNVAARHTLTDAAPKS